MNSLLERRQRRLQVILPIVCHLVSLGTYLRPLTSSSHLISDPSPVLDEAHIVSTDNADVLGTSSLADVFKNDYWGRPMNSPSSHKSWRPFTILTFRCVDGGHIFGWGNLFVQRLINVMLHATVAETCSIIATKLFVELDALHSLVLRAMTKLLFALHPAHVEVVANAANRPHIMAILMSSLMLDPATNAILVFVAGVVGLLSSETMVFQLPAVLATMSVIRWKSRYRRTERTFRSFLAILVSLIPRYCVVVALGLLYVGGRKYYDTLSIPDGLIRPAENPFYALTGTTRILTYAFLLSIHLGKAVLIDPIGFSHEYGFECIRNVADPLDVRLLAPFAVYVAVGLVTILCWRKGCEPTLTWAVAVSWLLTLFPVSGVIKVGTSVADRIVVAATFAFAIFGGRLLTYFLLDVGVKHNSSSKKAARSQGSQLMAASSKVAVCFVFASLYSRVHRRSFEWMDSLSLLESSLESCPRSAKSNLEISKIYSGLYKEKFDLTKAISYLEKAEKIDPEYCDIHQQFAHCHIQEGKYLEFEERLTRSVLCPFTMGQSIPLWQRYWKQVTSDPNSGEHAKRRMDKYQVVINEAIKKEAEKEEKVMSQQTKQNSDSGGTDDEL